MFKRSFFFRYLSPYTGQLAINVLLRSLSAVFAAILVFSVAPLLSLLFGTSQTQAAGGSAANALMGRLESWVELSIAQNGKPATLAWVVAALFLAYLLKNLCAYMGLYWFTPIRNKVVARMRNDLFHKFLILPLSFYAQSQKGDLLARISYNTQDVDSQILNQVQQSLVDVITVIILVAMLFFISVPLTLFVLALIPVIGLATSFISRSLKRRSRDLQNSIGRISSQVTQSLEGIKAIRSYNATGNAIGKFTDESRLFYKLNRRVEYRLTLSSPINEVLGTAAVVTILIAGGFLILRTRTLRPEIFIVYLLTMIQILPSSKNIITAYFTYRSGKGSLARIKEVLQAEEVIEEKADALPVAGFEHEIAFEDVSFSYGEKTTLEHVNLRIGKGRFIALVGPSGGGKSTLLNMIPRFFDPCSGKVTIDGKDLRDCKIDDIRALSSLVSQDTILFNDTIFNNILIGNPQATRQEVEQAARLADAHGFIMAKESGYDSPAGEGGSKLSGGQRQRLSIARALVKQAPVLLFDEATSALDTETENRIMQALKKNGRERNQTIISVAHRLSSIRDADEIIVVDNGRIVGRGTHQELFEHNPLYHELCRMQDQEKQSREKQGKEKASAPPSPTQGLREAQGPSRQEIPNPQKSENRPWKERL